MSVTLIFQNFHIVIFFKFLALLISDKVRRVKSFGSVGFETSHSRYAYVAWGFFWAKGNQDPAVLTRKLLPLP